ncbi:integrator complex subunit 6-like isoform X1 [Canis lupus baileyi]|uniref:integrator complex subunit 6-like isoform X1 n=2 Tax=Canis lupus baileyi TaxID=143281 RepID=UPI003B97CB8F
MGAIVTHDIHNRKMENNPNPPEGFLPKPAAPEVMNMSGAGIPPNQMGSPCDDFIKDDLIHKPGSNSLGGGTKSHSVSTGDPKGPTRSSPGSVPNKLHIRTAMANKINDDIKYQLMKEVRKFGRKYERVFTLKKCKDLLQSRNSLLNIPSRKLKGLKEES